MSKAAEALPPAITLWYTFILLYASSSPYLAMNGSQKAAFDSAIVLLLNISGGTRSGLAIDTDRELLDVYKCMALLRQMEAR